MKRIRNIGQRDTPEFEKVRREELWNRSGYDNHRPACRFLCYLNREKTIDCGRYRDRQGERFVPDGSSIACGRGTPAALARRQPTAAAALRLLKSADCCVASPSVVDTPPPKDYRGLIHRLTVAGA